MKPPPLCSSVLFFVAMALSAGCRVKVGDSPAIQQSAYTPEEEAAALQSVRSFMAELDRDQGDTWGHLSEMLKATTMKPVWLTTTAGFKAAFGKNLERGQLNFAFTDKLPSAPSGRYYVCDISSKFERGDVTERVVLVSENEKWKVAGYFRTKQISFQRDAKVR